MAFEERESIDLVRGTKQFISLRLGELPDGSPVLMPIMAVVGAQEGPTLAVTGCLHGDEVLGTDIIRRVAISLDPASMRGNFIGVPMGNRPAVAVRNRRNLLELYPGPQDMNRVFPGSSKGIMSERAAALLFDQVLTKADAVCDIHAAVHGAVFVPNANIPPVAECSSAEVHQRTAALARAFGTSFLFDNSAIPNSIRMPLLKKGIPATMAEFGEAMVIDRESLQFGIQGLTNLMKHLEIMPGKPVSPAEQTLIKKHHRVVSNRGGFLQMRVGLGEKVTEGQVLAEIEDLLGGIVETVVSPVTGYVVIACSLGVVGTGDRIANIGEIE